MVIFFSPGSVVAGAILLQGITKQLIPHTMSLAAEPERAATEWPKLFVDEHVNYIQSLDSASHQLPVGSARLTDSSAVVNSSTG